jgi:hypothetical protein
MFLWLLNRSRIVSIVGELVTGRVTKHVRITAGLPSSLHQPPEPEKVKLVKVG